MLDLYTFEVPLMSNWQEHVKNHIKLDTTGMLAGLTDDGSLITFFASKYSASNFV